MSTQPAGLAALRPTSNLWASALQDLRPEERETVNSHTKTTTPIDLLEVIENKQQDAWKNRISIKRSSGEVVFLHDIFAKLARGVKKFIDVGDIAVQYDPTHAALPWAAVRFILQASICDVQCQAVVLESVEQVAQTIPLGAIHECLYLAGHSAAVESHRVNLTKLYTLCWSSLANALRFHDRSKMKRLLSNLLDLESDFRSVSERIANEWTLVERSATLIRAETLLLQISNSQSHIQQLLRMMDDIKTPVSRIETCVEEDHQTLDKMQRDRILESISTIPYPKHQARVRNKVLFGTGNWLLENPLVKKWFSSSSSEILWLHGIPGSGKSCLVSTIVEKLIAESTHHPSTYPAYFYCARDPAETERAEPTCILRSILRQLSMPRSTKSLPTCVVDNFNKERGFFLDISGTLQLMMDIIRTRPITYIILDALDECDVGLRFELTDALETIFRESQSLVKIFVSSRNDLDLVCWLREYPNKEVLSSDNQADLAAFVDDEVDKRVDGKPRRLLRARKISDNLRDDIKQILKAQAQGMFRWVELQLQYLCKLFTEEDVRQRLGALPKDLTGIYHDIYQRNMSGLRDVDPQYEADAKKVFHLMLSSHQRWSPTEMANMLDPAPNAALRLPEKVLGLTAHLITHDRELNVLRFAHLSVREYFENHLPEFTPSRNLEAAVMACIDYLDNTRDLGFRPLSYPSRNWYSDVLELAGEAMSAQLADRLVQFLVTDTRTFESWLKEMVEERNRVLLQWRFTSVDILVSDDASTVFVACALGLADILACLITMNPSCVHARNLEGNSPLLVACEGSSKGVVSLLLQNGAAINERVGRDQSLTTLGAALSVTYPSIAIIRELLEHGADSNCSHGRDGASVFQIAASRRCIGAVELLLKYGADPNLATGSPSQTALYSAVQDRDGSHEVVRMLLEAGASVKIMDGVRNDALQIAVKARREDIVTTLLSFGADVNARDAVEKDKWGRVRERRSLLFLAIAVGVEQIVRQLLTHGADPVPRNYAERAIHEKFLRSGDIGLAKSLLLASNPDLRAPTIIQAARLFGEDELFTRLDILREREPDVGELREAMALAAELGLVTVFGRLVDHAYNCSLLCSSASWALSGAARRGQSDMFEILWTSLRSSSSTQDVGGESFAAEQGGSNTFFASLHAALPACGQRTRFSCLLKDAATGGATDTVQLILGEGADAASEIQNNGAWFLQAAVKASQADMVDFLLRLGADANATAPGDEKQSALCTALLERKDLSIVKLLLDGGADVSSRTVHEFGTPSNRTLRRGTAITLALLGANNFQESSAAVIELLLQHGADANAPDEEHGRVLQLAVSQRHIRAVELLLAHGADVNKGGGKHGSPLIAAVALANERATGTKFIEILLKNGADVNANHLGDYGIALRAALSEHGLFGVQILQLLVTHGADMLATGRDGAQALQIACAHYMYDEHRAEFLLSRGADVNASGGEYGNALQAACANMARSTLVELLIAKGAEVNARGGRFGSALQAASLAGSTDKVQVLLANGADIHANDGEYGHALQAAARSANQLPTLKLLLSHGANINACGGKYGTVLQAACVAVGGRCDENVINFLLDRGADVNRPGGEYGFALICAAAESRLYSRTKTEIISLLLDRGADINCSHEKHGNSLYAACQNSCMPAMEMLIDRGVSVTQLAGEHEHALFVACLKSSYGRRDDELVRFLLDHGVDVNICGKRTSCALEVAIKAENLKAAKLLIERGADLSIETEGQDTLLDIAIRSSSTEMVELLRANGA